MKILIGYLLLFSSLCVQAQNKDYTSPYPKFIPYQVERTYDSTSASIADYRELGLEQPTRWLQEDPLADKYPGWSPYNYCINNPVILIDFDGRDWFRHNQSGATFWMPSSEKSVTVNEQAYRNIGENYSTFSNGLRIDYSQNEVVGMSEVDPNFNLEGSQYIPKSFTTDDGSNVNVTFNYYAKVGGNGDKSISVETVSALISSVNEANTKGAGIKSLDVSCTTNGKHSAKSLHYLRNGARAIDIDVVNGTPVKNTQSHQKVDALQTAAGNQFGTYENFGPNIQTKRGRPHPISHHENHIHISTVE